MSLNISVTSAEARFHVPGTTDHRPETSAHFEALLSQPMTAPLDAHAISGSPLGEWLSALAKRKGQLNSETTDPGLLTPDMGTIPMMTRLSQLRIQHDLLGAEMNVVHATISKGNAALNTLIKGS